LKKNGISEERSSVVQEKCMMKSYKNLT